MARRVLVTGFDPFGGEKINASREVVRALGSDTVSGVELTTRELPTEFGRAPRVLVEAVRNLEPEVVVCLGQARGRPQVTPERVAVNVADAPRIPDNAGLRPTDEPVVEGGPVAYRSTLPVKEIVAALKRVGIPAAVSDTAGTFVCNSVFYRLMHLLGTERPSIRGGFVHVPVLTEQAPDGSSPSMPLGDIVRAVELVISTSVARQTPRAPVRTSPAPRR